MLKRLTLFLVIFSLPFQLGLHFWIPETYVKSFKIDYLAPTLYLTDIFILLFLVFNYRQIISIVRKFVISLSGLFLIILVALNLWTSSFSVITISAWLKLFEYFLLFIALKETKDLHRSVIRPFSISLGLVVLLALLQFIIQSSLGGVFYYFGERAVSPLLSNIAKINHTLPFLPSPLLRPYSTFSHPNSLAGFLLVSLLIFSLITKNKFARFPLILTLLLTFSKVATLSLIFMEIVKLSLLQNMIVGLLLSLAPLAKDLTALPSWLAQSFITRHYLLFPSLKIVADHWFLGVGLRRFIPTFADYLPANQISYSTLQPVHNTFLLALAELGAVGVGLFCLIIWRPISKPLRKKKTHSYLVDLFGIILVTGSLDHYWWTLPQNQLIIVLALALIINSSSFPSPVIRRGRVNNLAGEVKQSEISRNHH